MSKTFYVSRTLNYPEGDRLSHLDYIMLKHIDSSVDNLQYRYTCVERLVSDYT